MILMGDEVGRTQHGNNNAYCQDNEIAWLEWKDVNDRDRAFMEFMRGVIRLRSRYKLLRTTRFLHAKPIDEKGTRDVVWLRPDGKEMDPGSWTNPVAKVVGLLLSDVNTRLLILVNAYHEPIAFKLPDGQVASGWQVRADTAAGAIDPPDRGFAPADSVTLEGRSLLLLAGVSA
jgi:glycogen operon protein